jgi:L-asparaginase/beta-aspartyl-peptidase (threonine type)
VSRERHRRALEALRTRTGVRAAWAEADVEAIWNFASPLPPELRPHDTVGAVARDREGRFATANSTGGAVPMLLGRLGDSPVPGAGFWAGGAGAVAATGVGEEIIRRMASYEIHLRLLRGVPAAEALAEVIALFPAEISFGACVLSATGHAVLANRPMAAAFAAP